MDLNFLYFIRVEITIEGKEEKDEVLFDERETMVKKKEVKDKEIDKKTTTTNKPMLSRTWIFNF